MCLGPANADAVVHFPRGREWATSCRVVPPPLRSKMPSSFSSMRARAASPSGPSSTSTRTAASCRRTLEWCAGSAEPRSPCSRSKRLITVALHAKNGKGFDSQRNPSRSTCTTSRSPRAAVDFGARCKSAGSWTWCVPTAWRRKKSSAMYGQKIVTRSGSFVEDVRTTSGPMLGRRRRRRLKRRTTLSTRVGTAAWYGRLRRRTCSATRASRSARSAIGSNIHRRALLGSPRRQRLPVTEEEGARSRTNRVGSKSHGSRWPKRPTGATWLPPSRPFFPEPDGA